MSNNLIALDIGEKRIGVARADSIAKIAYPLATIKNDADFIKNINGLLEDYPYQLIVVGYPRSLNGQETLQTDYTKKFVAKYLKDYNIVWQDETLSTQEAAIRGKSSFGIDADAACIILEDYIRDNL